MNYYLGAAPPERNPDLLEIRRRAQDPIVMVPTVYNPTAQERRESAIRTLASQDDRYKQLKHALDQITIALRTAKSQEMLEEFIMRRKELESRLQAIVDEYKLLFSRKTDDQVETAADTVKSKTSVLPIAAGLTALYFAMR